MSREVLSIPCDKIVFSPANRRKGRFLRIEELAESIRLHGLLQEPLVRPIDNDMFEVVAGERRIRAASLLGNEVLVKIREMDAVEAHELTFAENHDREELEPLEEAEFIEVMIADGKTIEEIAAKFGRSVQWVARRSKLMNLAPSIKESLQSEGDDGISGWSTAHLELLARFEHHTQESFLNSHQHFSGWSLDDLKDSLDEYLMKLSVVPWKLEDESLDADAGACSTCPKRTSLQTSLFDELTEKGKVVDRCIDKDCWVKKHKVFVERKAQSLREKNPELITIDASNYSDSILEDDDPLKENAIRGFVECKKSDPGAKQAIVVDGRGAGSTKWVQPSSHFSSGSRSSNGPKTLEERYDGLSRKRLSKVLASIIEILTSETTEPALITRLDDESAMAIAVIWGCRRLESFDIATTSDFHATDSWKQYDTFVKQNKSSDYYIDVARCVLPGWIEILRVYADSKTYAGMASAAVKARVTDANAIAERICKFLKIDFKDIVRQTEMEIKPPKSWEKLNDDGTKKDPSEKSDDEESLDPESEPEPAKKTRKSKKTTSYEADDDSDIQSPEDL